MASGNTLTPFGLPVLAETDVTAVTSEGLSDEDMLILRTSNPVLHGIILAGLNIVAPGDPRQKKAYRDLLGNILHAAGAATDREVAEAIATLP